MKAKKKKKQKKNSGDCLSNGVKGSTAPRIRTKAQKLCEIKPENETEAKKKHQRQAVKKIKMLPSFVPQSFDGQEQTVNGPKGSGT